MSRFSKDETASIVGTYEADAVGSDYESRSTVVKAIAMRNNVTINVIRGVLVAEGVYVKQEASASTKATRVDKVALGKAFEDSFGIKMPSITNMTGKDLQAFWDRFVEMSAIRDASEGKK